MGRYDDYNFQSIGKDLANAYDDGYNDGYADAKQEVAREILQTIKNHRNGIEDRLKDSVWEVSGTDLNEEFLCEVVDEYGFFDILDEIAEEYSVEVE